MKKFRKQKIEVEDVPLIRGLLKAGLPTREIAEKFEVSTNIILRIKNRETWAWIEQVAE
tara:strand:+ start:7964 stop:8140 length:177 start_codon:yes stop_codon:yes gene_type:complete